MRFYFTRFLETHIMESELLLCRITPCRIKRNVMRSNILWAKDSVRFCCCSVLSPASYFLAETVTNPTTDMKVRIASYTGLSKPTDIRIYTEKNIFSEILVVNYSWCFVTMYVHLHVCLLCRLCNEMLTKICTNS